MQDNGMQALSCEGDYCGDRTFTGHLHRAAPRSTSYSRRWRPRPCRRSPVPRRSAPPWPPPGPRRPWPPLRPPSAASPTCTVVEGLTRPPPAGPPAPSRP
eukprot:1895356-Pleurochrysis_carterae.AAC.1